MDLLERELQLAALAEYAADVRRGEGRLVLVAGEAGVGKTSLVETLEERLPHARFAWGGCDGGFTPPPLGPLDDVALALGGQLADLTRAGAPREARFAALLRELGASEPLTVLVLEDLHWADEATLDLVRFLGRRLRRQAGLVVATYRDEGLDPTHPLRLCLGALASERSTRRLDLPRLTPPAVARLALGSGLDAGAVYAVTGGNPYFVSEVLGSGSLGLPTSARDAVLARVAGLRHGARAALQAAAVVGTRVDPDLVREISAVDDTELDELVSSGLLVSDGTHLRFRHELARLAVAEATPAHRRTDLHRRALTALLAAGSVDDAVLAHHADEAGSGELVLRHAPPAAARAASSGAHREAALQLERAVRWATTDDHVRAGLLDLLATEYGMLDRWEEADETCRDALRLWRRLGEPVREGDTLRRLSRTAWRLGQGAECEARTVEAVEVLTPFGRTPELARAVAQLASQRMLHGGFIEAMELADRAVEMASELGLPDVEADALNTSGCSRHGLGEEWQGHLRRAVDLAVQHRLTEQAGRAYVNLFGSLKVSSRHVEAERTYDEAASYCEDHDVPTYGNCLLGERAECLERTGRWAEAEAAALALLHKVDISPINKVHTWIVLGQLQVRRGSDDVDATIRSGVELVDGMGEEQYAVPIGLIRVERHWLSGDRDAAAALLAEVAGQAQHLDPWTRGSVAVWQQRLGLVPTLGEVASPYSEQLAGDHVAAARRWQALGVPYEAAQALLDGDDPEGWREALDILDGLGATASAAAARARLRTRGMRVPAGRRATTRAHPAGLTAREDDVARLVADGLTNDEIAARLVISAKTVDHHVSSVLGKLGVGTRRDVGAALLALEDGELQPTT